ncbi:MAG: NAD+ synthase [Aeropyrum sp.]|nr:NAD+ synthase [Aeropyrum sp.]
MDDVLDFDFEAARSKIEEFIVSYLESSGAKGYIVGLSGGVDSSLVAALAVSAVGSSRVMALIMPDSTVTPEADVEDAKWVAGFLGIKYNVIDISPIVDVYRSSIPISEESDKIPIGNLRARIRASLLYYYANKLDLIVLGTGDRSEFLIGYFTKYGDAAVDIAPILVLYKTQVRRLARIMGIKEEIAYKPSSPRLWPGHLAEKELGASYEEVDVILYSRFDLGLQWEEIPDVTRLPKSTVDLVRRRYEESRHKREPPASPKLEEFRSLFKRLA